MSTRNFPPGATEADVRWMICRIEGEEQSRIIEVVDYMFAIPRAAKRYPDDEHVDLWVCPLDDTVPGFFGMGAHVSTRNLHATREAAVAVHVAALEAKLKAIQQELGRWLSPTA